MLRPDRQIEQVYLHRAPQERGYLTDNYLRILELSVEETLQCLQMALPAEVTPPLTSLELTQLCARDAPQMVTLTDLAFPGFLRDRTYAMGSYYGVRSDGELIAMGGERLMLDGYPKISGICTHPAHRGSGFAAGINWQLVRNHRRNGLVSWLHVGAANTRAIALYVRLGFAVSRPVRLERLRRTG